MAGSNFNFAFNFQDNFSQKFKKITDHIDKQAKKYHSLEEKLKKLHTAYEKQDKLSKHAHRNFLKRAAAIEQENKTLLRLGRTITKVNATYKAATAAMSAAMTGLRAKTASAFSAAGASAKAFGSKFASSMRGVVSWSKAAGRSVRSFATSSAAWLRKSGAGVFGKAKGAALLGKQFAVEFGGSFFGFMKAGTLRLAGFLASNVGMFFRKGLQQIVSTGKVALGVSTAASAYGIYAAADKESNLAALSSFLGEREASEVYERARTTKSPFYFDTLTNAYKVLAGAGAKGRDLDALVKGIGDLASTRTGHQRQNEALTTLAKQFAHSLTKGVYDQMELRHLSDLPGGELISQDRVLDILSKTTGLGSRDAVLKAMNSNQIEARTGFNAVLLSLQEKFGPLGAAMNRQYYTLNGLIATLKSLPKRVFSGLPFETSTGFTSLRGAATNFIDALMEKDNPLAVGLSGFLDKILNSAFGSLSGEKGMERVKLFLNEAKSAIDVLGNLAVAFSAGVSGFFSSLMDGIAGPSGSTDWDKVTAGAKALGEALGTIASYIIRFGTFIAESPVARALLMTGAGAAGGGLVAGPYGALVGGAAGGFAGYTHVMDSWSGDIAKSISGYKASAGGGTPPEWEDPWINAEGGVYDKPTSAIVGEAGPEAIVPLGRAKRSHGEGLAGLLGGNGPTINVSVSVDARGNGSGADIAHQIAEALPSALANALEGLALQTGGAY